MHPNSPVVSLATEFKTQRAQNPSEQQISHARSLQVFLLRAGDPLKGPLGAE